MSLADLCRCEACVADETPAACEAEHRFQQDHRAAHAAEVHERLARLEALVSCGDNVVRDVAMGLLSLARMLHEAGGEDETVWAVHEPMVALTAWAHRLLALDDWGEHRARLEYRAEE